MYGTGTKIRMKKEFPVFVSFVNREGALGEIIETYSDSVYTYRIALDPSTFPSECSLSREIFISEDEFENFFEVTTSFSHLKQENKKENNEGERVCLWCGRPTEKLQLMTSCVDFCKRCGK